MTEQLLEIFGGYDLSSQNYRNSSALLVHFIYNEDKGIQDVLDAWEKEYLEVVSQTHDNIKLDYASSVRSHFILSSNIIQRSFDDFLATDGSVSYNAIIITFAVTFIYISICLGSLLQVQYPPY
jgi:hypothetical protein